MSEEEKYNKILNLMLEIGEFYKKDDWMFVKKYAIRYSHPDDKKILSTRHSYTKKHKLNDVEKRLIEDYYKSTNIKLELKEKDKHYESDLNDR
tara:strand:+ start:199 stop:477 length:279 start_codon:yes stop_codon:yes gene_type:complete